MDLLSFPVLGEWRGQKKLLFFYLKLGFTPCKAERHYKAWSYKKKKHKKIKTYRKSVLKEPAVKRCLLILDLNPFWFLRVESVHRLALCQI